MSISYEEIGQVLVTCKAAAGVKEENMVKFSGNDTVSACSAGEAFCGLAVGVSEDGYAAVQVKGFCTVPCTGSVAVGWQSLTADGNGGVKSADTGEQGVNALVVSVNSGSAVICL